MWFISFAFVAGLVISFGVYGWATYLQHQAVQRSEFIAPLPPPRPKLQPPPKAQPVRAEAVEIVREPKQTWSKNGRGWNARGWHAQKWNAQQKWSAQKSWSKPNKRSRQNRWHETW